MSTEHTLVEIKKIVLKKYEILQQAEEHFLILQYKYRQYAIYWLMGTFAGVGFLMSKELSHGIFDTTLLISGVTIAGSIGLGLLWLLDIFLYQKMLDAVLIEALEMEKKNTFLPNVKNKLYLIVNDVNPLIIQNSFYLVIILMCLSVSLVSLLLYQYKMGDMYLVYLFPVKVVLIVLSILYTYKNIRNSSIDLII